MPRTSIPACITLSVLVTSLFVGAAWGDIGPKRTAKDDNRLNEYVRSLGALKQPEESGYTLKSQEDKSIRGYECQSETYEGHPGFNSFLFSRSNVDVMYPGALLSGQSIRDKSYTLSGIRPGPLTLTVNLQGIEGPISQTIGQPAFSTVQTAIHDILSQKMAGDAGAEMSWSIENVYSKSHLNASLGANVKVEEIFGAKESLGLDFSYTSKTAIIKFNQKYYDVVIDLPRSPAEFISSDFTVRETRKIFEETSPAYVSAVSYGRYVLFVFETSDLSIDLEKELTASLTLPVEGVPVEAGVSATLDAGFKNGTLKSQAFILGGSGEQATKAITSLSDVVAFIKTGGRYSKDSPGRPISYNLRYLSDNKPVTIVNATNFEKVRCSKIFRKYRVRAVSFELTKKQGIALPQIDLSGILSAKSGGQKAYKETGELWRVGWNIGRYPIRANEQKNINAVVDVSFGEMTPAERKQAYIDFEMKVKGGWAGIFENFQPQNKRIYLDELAEGDFTEVITTQWHILKIHYNVEGLE